MYFSVPFFSVARCALSANTAGHVRFPERVLRPRIRAQLKAARRYSRPVCVRREKDGLLFVGEISFANNHTSSSICAIKTQHVDVPLPYIFHFIFCLFQMTIYIFKNKDTYTSIDDSLKIRRRLI